MASPTQVSPEIQPAMELAELKEEEMEEEKKEKKEEGEEEEEEGEKEEKEEGEDIGLGNLQELEETLGEMQIDLSAPRRSEPQPKVDPSECPPSYSKNSVEETLMLSMAENFHTQYSYLYPDRKPLLLFPVNEVGVQKFVSTTLRSVLIPYPELNDWQGCATFIADFLTLEHLECPTEVPKQLCSPTWMVQTRTGTCFEYSTLLCSLLLGAGYNAYCVSGYAVKEMCTIDLRHQECPLTKPQDTVEGKSPENEEDPKYKVKPARELKSTFKQRQEEKNQQESDASFTTQKDESQTEDRPTDPLHGLRVHSWVLILAGKRDIWENFFIDPLSGQRFPTSSSCFLGIESIWNNVNYWVNMQDCRSGCTGMTYDLQDSLTWEYMLCSPSSDSVVAPPDTEDEDQEEQEEQKDEDDTEDMNLFKMPRSWVSQIHISEEDMASRFSDGSKLIHYRKAIVEKFSPYLLKDGLVMRLTTYDDAEYTQADVVTEWYKSRQDKLQEREWKNASNVTTEHFLQGRSFCLKTHRFVSQVPESEHFMEFYSKAREDNLVTRLVTATEMTETFQERLDFLYYRQVIYRPLEPAQKHGVQRPIQKIVVKFHRNQSKPADEDIAEIIFQISQNQIEVMFHLGDDRIIPNFDIYQKPAKPDDPITDKMCSSFEVTDLFENPAPKRNIQQSLESLLEKEENFITSIKASEKEVRDILEVRDQEESDIEMKISFYDMARNEKARQHVETQKLLAQEKQQKKEFKDLDILASFLAQWGDPESLSKQQAVQINANCLEHLKQRAVDMANRIQARYEKETEALQQKQQWYQRNRSNLTKQEEEAYMAYCSDAMFRIRILQLRLNRHKDSSLQKYASLNKRLRQDSRLKQHLATP